MKKELNVIFGEKLKSLRTLHGFTQKELGKKLGVSDATTTYYEKGEREPKRATLFKLADIFGVSINYFFEGMENIEIHSFDVFNKSKSNSLPILGY